jgi:AAA15 family ATPase/GTPase
MLLVTVQAYLSLPETKALTLDQMDLVLCLHPLETQRLSKLTCHGVSNNHSKHSIPHTSITKRFIDKHW